MDNVQSIKQITVALQYLLSAEVAAGKVTPESIIQAQRVLSQLGLGAIRACRYNSVA